MSGLERRGLLLSVRGAVLDVRPCHVASGDAGRSLTKRRLRLQTWESKHFSGLVESDFAVKKLPFVITCFTLWCVLFGAGQ